jgi:hypothetical protein
MANGINIEKSMQSSEDGSTLGCSGGGDVVFLLG